MKKIFPLLFLFLLAHLFLLINIGFTAWPEMGSFPYLFNNGFRLYGDMVHAYPPLLTILLAGTYKIFGYELLVLKIFTWTGILFSDVLIFLIVRRLTGKNIYAFLSFFFYIATQPFLDGNMLWFDTALTLPILLAVYFRRNLFWAGIFLAAAVLIKQTAAIFIFAFIVYLIFMRIGLKKILLFLSPIVVSTLVFMLWLTLTEQLNHFYNWNFYYPSAFWTKYPSYTILSLTKRELLSIVLILLPSLAIFILRFKEIFKSKDLLLFLFLGAGIIAVYPRFSFYHFQPALAISAIIFGYCIKFLKINSYSFGIYLLPLFIFVSMPILKTDWGKDVRFWGSGDLALARIIQSEVPAGESIYLLGPHSGLYVLSGRLPPKPWIDNFGWYLEIPGISEEAIIFWEGNPPAVVLIQNPNPGQWYEIGTYQPKKIIEWIKGNYNKERELTPGIWLWRKK